MSARNTLKQKAIRREERKLRKGGVNMSAYSFTDIETQSAKITEMHKADQSLNALIKEKYGIIRPIWDLKVALAAINTRVTRFLSGNSKYQPHQGKSEIARRQRQIEAGLLQVSAA